MASVLSLPTSAQASAQSNPNANASFGSNLANAFGLSNSQQYNSNKQFMNVANNFNNYMANTAYQRTVKDMESAGINPLIAFGLGKGQLDASPTSAMASVSSTSGKFGEFLQGLIRDLLYL